MTIGAVQIVYNAQGLWVGGSNFVSVIAGSVGGGEKVCYITKYFFN